MLYPKNTLSRTVHSLNGVWNFKLEDNLHPVDVSKPLHEPISMSVPGSFNDQGQVREIRMHTGSVVYEREFTVNKLLSDQRLVLRLDAATHQAWVYINGVEVTYHKGGFVPFTVEINDHIKPGKNRVTVRVSNIIDYTSLPVGNYSQSEDENGLITHKVVENFDFFNYAGLNRYVRLYTTPWTYVDDIAIYYDVDLENNTADVNVDSTVVGEHDELRVTILDEDGDTVVSGSGVETVLRIEDLKLWQPLNAYLYTALVEVLKDGVVIDVYEEEFGVRTVEVKGTQFLINGKPFYFKGAGKHEDSYVNGRGINEAYNVSDINLLKWMGANSIRTSHYPYSEEMMRLCDREGIVVIDESAGVGMFEGFSVDSASGMKAGGTWNVLDTKEAHEQAMRELIARDKNHACVVLWSIMNEPDSSGPGAREYFEHIFDYTRKLDPQNRPLTYVNFQVCGVNDDVCMDLADIICINRYFGWYWNLSDFEQAEKDLAEDLEAWHAKYPDKPIMINEFGADTVAGLHAVDDIPFTEDYQVKYYQTNCEVFDRYDFFVGEQIWNFADFETKTGINRVQGNKKGIFTRGREPKAAARYLKERWTNIPDFDYKK